MPTMIDRDRVHELLDGGGQLVEVLPASAYEHRHLPEAVNLPLKEFSEQAATDALDRGRPVITYCSGFF